METPAILTDRLELRPLSATAIRALIARDAAAFAVEVAIRAPVSIELPPLMDDALPYLADQIARDPGRAAWWCWAIVRHADAAFIGSAGFAGPPGADGAVTLGYAVYPAFERQGYASETVRALTGWAFANGATRVRATVPSTHLASIRVVEKAGFIAVGSEVDPEAGDVIVFQTASVPAAPDVSDQVEIRASFGPSTRCPRPILVPQ